MHQPVITHPIFAALEACIDAKEYKLIKDDDSWHQELNFYFKSGWRKWIKISVRYSSRYDSLDDKINSVYVYVKPGFMQPHEYISDDMVPVAVIHKIKTIAKEIIKADRERYALQRQNRLASALDTL